MAILPDSPIPGLDRPHGRRRVLAECALLAIESWQGRPRKRRLGTVGARNRTIEAGRAQQWQQAQQVGNRFRRA